MAVQTEPKYIGDVVKFEEDSRFSRAKETVESSQTLVLGAVCRTGGVGRKVAVTAPVNEVQLAAITGTLTAGSWTFSFRDSSGAKVITDPIAFDANTAAIQTGIDTALGANKVVINGTAITAMVLTYSGADYAGLPQELAILDVSDLTGEEDSSVSRTTAGGAGGESGADEVQTITVTGTPTAGTFTLKFVDESNVEQTTAAIAWDASTATIQTAVDLVLNPDDSVVLSGTAVTAQIYTFSGVNFEKRNQAPVVMDISLLTGATAVANVETTRGGSGGTQPADSIILEDVTSGASNSIEANFLVRDAVVKRSQLVIGTAVMQDVEVELAAVGIVVRD